MTHDLSRFSARLHSQRSVPPGAVLERERKAQLDIQNSMRRALQAAASSDGLISGDEELIRDTRRMTASVHAKADEIEAYRRSRSHLRVVK